MAPGTSPLTLVSARQGLVQGILQASAMMADAAKGRNTYQQGQKLKQVERALGFLDFIGAGKAGAGLVASASLHAAVAAVIERHGLFPNPKEPTVRIEPGSNQLDFGGFTVTFVRTLRVPDDGKTYKLPAGVGQFPVRRVEDFKDRVPATWREHGGAFVPMYQREALWLSFKGSDGIPRAVKIAAGKVNAVSGQPWRDELRKSGDPDYVVAPEPQLWLDGWNAGNDGAGHRTVRQFVAIPLGMGYTVEKQVTGREDVGGVQILVRAPTPEGVVQMKQVDILSLMARLAEVPPAADITLLSGLRAFGGGGLFRGDDGLTRGGGGGDLFALSAFLDAAPVELGLAAGGRIEQQIFDDPHGWETWNQAGAARVFVHLVDSMSYRAITGQEPPPTPIDRHTYAAHGVPWFAYYDEAAESVGPARPLAKVHGVAAIDAEHGFTTDAAAPVATEASPLVVLGPGGKGVVVVPPADDPHAVKDGEW